MHDPDSYSYSKIMLETRNHKEILEQISGDYEHSSELLKDCNSGMGTLYAEAIASARSMKESVLKGMLILDAMKVLTGYEVHIGEEYVTQAYARIGSVDEVDPVAEGLLETSRTTGIRK